MISSTTPTQPVIANAVKLDRAEADRVQAIVAQAPPLAPEQRDRLRRLVGTHTPARMTRPHP